LEHRSDPLQPGDDVHGVRRDGGGHPAELGGLGILHHHRAAGPSHGASTLRAIRPGPGEDHRDQGLTINPGGALHQPVHGRHRPARAILREFYLRIRDVDVMIGRHHEDHASL